MPSIDIFAQILQARKYAARLEWRQQRERGLISTEPLSDKTFSGSLKGLASYRAPRFLFGTIVDVLPYPHWYKVASAHHGTNVLCCHLSASSLTQVGAKSLAQLAIGDRVLFAWPENEPEGIIIGVRPPMLRDGRDSLADFVSQQSRCGIQVDRTHQAVLSTYRQGGVIDWSADRPVDALSVGENGWMTETGGAIFIDPFMSFLRADEDCGVWAFLHDRLLRLSGKQMQIRSQAHESEYRNDRGELGSFENYAAYLWESLGAFSPDDEVHREYTATQAQLEEPEYGVLEPLHDDQMGFHRIQNYSGYGGSKRLIFLPPVSESGLNRLSSRTPTTALFNETIGLDGDYSVISAHGIMLAKRVSVPGHKQVQLPENLTDEDYRHAGHYGTGDAQYLPHTSATAVSAEQVQQRQAGALDTLALTANFRALHPMVARAAMYLVPEEREAEPFGVVQETIDFSVLSDGGLLPAPPEVLVEVDHLSGEVTYYANQSLFRLSPDGSVQIRDGSGCEFKSGGGNWELDAPGDILFKAGRNIAMMAGHDVTARAHNALDLSTTTDSIRIRSADELKMKGDGVLIDSRGDLRLRCPDHGLYMWSDMTYIKAGVGTDGRGIFLDSGEGQGIISTTSRTFERMITDAAMDYFGASGSFTVGNVFTADGTTISGDLSVSECGIFGNRILSGDWIVCNGHFASELSGTYGRMVSTLSGANLTAVDNAVAAVIAAPVEIGDLGDDLYANQWLGCIYNASMPGNLTVIGDDIFLFRASSTDYKASQFVLYESYWQQLARLSGQTLGTWTELPEEDTYPFPGKERLVDEEAFRTQDLLLFDVAAGVSERRDSASYVTGALAEPTALTMDGNYPIIG